MTIHIDPTGRRAVVPANLTRSDVKRLRAAARGKRGTERGRGREVAQSEPSRAAEPDSAVHDHEGPAALDDETP